MFFGALCCRFQTSGRLGWALAGDPLDAFVLLRNPVIHRVLLAVRPMGVFLMSDEAGSALVEHFFRHYKYLEPGKHVDVEGWGDKAAAERLVKEAFDRANHQAASVLGHA